MHNKKSAECPRAFGDYCMSVKWEVEKGKDHLIIDFAAFNINFQYAIMILRQNLIVVLKTFSLLPCRTGLTYILSS